MNLAVKDIRHNIGRFLLTGIGIGMLLMMVMGMLGIYRGLIQDATLLIERIGADLWVVQLHTRGPFAEVSRVPRNLVDRVAAVPGVLNAREFVYHTIQREKEGRPLRMGVLGVSWPVDKGQWLPLIAGRPLTQAHFEVIADQKLGLRIGERLKLGKETYTVVGITRGNGNLRRGRSCRLQRQGRASHSIRCSARSGAPGTSVTSRADIRFGHRRLPTPDS